MLEIWPCSWKPRELVVMVSWELSSRCDDPKKLKIFPWLIPKNTREI